MKCDPNRSAFWKVGWEAMPLSSPPCPWWPSLLVGLRVGKWRWLLLLLFSQGAKSTGRILTSEIVAVEVVLQLGTRGLIGGPEPDAIELETVAGAYWRGDEKRWVHCMTRSWAHLYMPEP